MATTKTLNTRIKLRYDTYANWTTNNPELLTGEIAIVEVPASVAAPGKLKDSDRPSLLFKVGVDPTRSIGKDANDQEIQPGTNGYHFNDLPWGSALGADVHAWAKKEHGAAGDINIADAGNKITATTVEGALQELATAISTMQGGDGEVSLASLQAAIELLNDDAETAGSVAYAIAEAITAEETRIDAVTGTPDSGKTLQGEIDDVEAAITTLNGNSSTTGSVAKAVADEATRIDAITGTPDSGKTLQQEIDAVEADVTTLKGDVNTTGSVAKSINDAITGLNLGTTYAGKAYESKVDTLIGSESGDDTKSARTMAAEEVAKVVANAPASYDTLKEIADWIQSDSTGAAKMANDISALKTKTELGTYDNNGTPTEYATVKAYVEAAVGAEATRTNGITGTPDSGKTLQGEIDDVESAIATLNGNSSTAGSVAKAVADEASRIDAITGTPDSGKTLQGEIDDVEAAITTLNGNNTTAGSVAKTVKDAIDAIDITVAANGQGETNKVLTGFEIENGGLKANSVTTTTLAAIATTGNVNDLVQTSGDTLIIDCGTSA